MKSILILSFAGLGINCFAQTPVNFSDCKTNEFFVTADQKPIWADSILTIKEYFFHYFKNGNYLGKASGKIMLGILISESGQPCCHSFFDLGKTELDPQEFKNAVNKMPFWKPGKQSNKEISFLYQIIIEVKKGEIIK